MVMRPDFKMNFNLVLLILAAVLCPIYSAPKEDMILSLPGLRKQPMFRMYSGYLEATGNRHLHYWLVESQRDPEIDPLVLWMNGGPGCSSMLAILTEHGPFTIQNDASLEYNPHSWNKIANVLYLEAPAGVGYSYSDDGNYTTDDDQVSLDNLAALKSFFQKFPEYGMRKFFVTGESYGGIYVPTLSERLIKETSINFQGFAIGNGMSDYNINENSIIYFGYYHGLYGSTLYNSLLGACCGSNVTMCSFTQNHSKQCVKLVQEAMLSIYNGQLNMYNLYDACDSTKMSAPSVQYHDFGNQFISHPFFQKGRTLLKTMPMKNLKLVPPCINGTATLVYLNDLTVRNALHIPNQLPKWELCSAFINVNYKRIYTTMTLQYQRVIAANKRIMLYNGDIDMACNFLGDEWFLDSLGLPVETPRKPWTYQSKDGTIQNAGFVKQYTNVSFVTIRGAGHMVPTDKPIPAFDLFEKFINNKRF